MSLRINGQYFVPVWAIVEIMDGTATGGLCKTCTGDKYCAPGVDNLCACFAQASVYSVHTNSVTLVSAAVCRP